MAEDEGQPLIHDGHPIFEWTPDQIIIDKEGTQYNAVEYILNDDDTNSDAGNEGIEYFIENEEEDPIKEEEDRKQCSQQ